MTKQPPRLARRWRAALRLSAPRERKKTSRASPSAASAAGNRPPVNSAAIETPVTAPTMISTRLGGIVSDIAAEAASCATSSPRRYAAALHFRHQHRRHGRLIRRLGAGDAGNQIHRRRSARRKARRGGGRPARPAKSTSARAMPVISSNRPSTTNIGTASSWIDGHALVHLADDHRKRHVGGEVDVGEGGDAEAEGDRHTEQKCRR